MDPPHASRRYGGTAQALHWIVAGLIVTRSWFECSQTFNRGASYDENAISRRRGIKLHRHKTM
jgi:hypothetical protein